MSFDLEEGSAKHPELLVRGFLTQIWMFCDKGIVCFFFPLEHFNLFFQ